MYQRKYRTDAERHNALANAARKAVAARMANGNNHGGRPKGSRNRRGVIPIADRTVFEKIAKAKNVTYAVFMHALAEKLKASYSTLFA